MKGPVEGAPVVRMNDPRQPEAQFALKGVVQPPIEFQPFGAIFLSAFRGETVGGSVQVLNHEDRPLRILGLESNSVLTTLTARAGHSGANARFPPAPL